jgi:uncharacterized protein YciI
MLLATILAINNRDATSTEISPFFATHSYHIDILRLIKDEGDLQTSGNTPIATGEAFVLRLQKAIKLAQAAIASAQERQEHYANQARAPSKQFKKSNKVWLRLRNIRTLRPSKKLD